MRRERSPSQWDVEAVDVLLEDEEDADEFLRVLHQLALEAIALRATSPGDPRTESSVEAPAAAEPQISAVRRLVRRLWPPPDDSGPGPASPQDP